MTSTERATIDGMTQPVLYKPGSTSISSTVEKNASGQLVTGWTGQRVADLLMQGYTVQELDDVVPQIEQATRERFCKAWVETTEEEFDDMLGALPPQAWTREHGREMFRMQEHTCMNITAHFARVGDRYFVAQREIGTPYADLYAEIADTFGIDTSANKED